LAILLISVPVFYAIAEPSEAVPLPTPETPNQEYWEEYNRQADAFYEAMHEGRLTEYDGAEIIKQWIFDYDQEQLLITTSDGEQYHSQIVIFRKDVNDDKITATSYTTNSVSGDNTVLPQELKLTENRLEIIKPKPTHVLMFRFFNDFTSAQFTSNGLFMGNSSHFYYSDIQVLYLEIPADLTIDTDYSTEYSLYFINE
jgi:hypothetical protein